MTCSFIMDAVSGRRYNHNETAREKWTGCAGFVRKVTVAHSDVGEKKHQKMGKKFSEAELICWMPQESEQKTPLAPYQSHVSYQAIAFFGRRPWDLVVPGRKIIPLVPQNPRGVFPRLILGDSSATKFQISCDT